MTNQTHATANIFDLDAEYENEYSLCGLRGNHTFQPSEVTCGNCLNQLKAKGIY